MGNRTANFISALIGSVIVGVPMAAVSQNAPSAPGATSTANATSDCLASPKGIAPQGQHWFYRLERTTKRQCWYLRAEGAKEGAKAPPSVQATADASNAAPAAPQSVQNAHAEYVAPQASAAPSAPAPAAVAPPQAPGTNADANAAQPAVVTPWPDAAAAAASPAPQPSPATPSAPATASAQPSAKPAPSPAPVTLAAADAPADKTTGSLQMLLLVVGGALALAGILASLIYRFAGGRRARVQTADRRVNWDYRQDDDDSRAPWHTEPVPAPRAERPLPMDFDAMHPQAPQIAAFSDAIGRIAAQGRPTEAAAAEPDETEIDYFDGAFEIEGPAPQLAAGSHDDEEVVDHAADAHQEHARRADVHEDHAHDENAVNIDIITAMLERLATEGPRLSQPVISQADFAGPARTLRGRPGVRA
ncbi:hypothetical protein JIR23_15750 [Bradyrhizobium diazoefficiens]|nr:hypothetical protein [Bradyrhizobium diazoefficiens]QQN67029.1 hypothetical protein JIR23_15750 [Bradyrhizobium diazoefficiens]